MARKKSLFSRFIEKVRKTTEDTTEYFKKVFEREKPPPLPPPETKEEEENWVRRTYSSFVKYSPWNIFRERKEKELKKQIEDLHKVKDIPDVRAEPLIDKPREEKLLIEEPEFESERFRASIVINDIVEKLSTFAADPDMYIARKGVKLLDEIGEVNIDINSAILADGTIIVSARFSDFPKDDEMYQLFMTALESVVHEFDALTHRISISHQIDPRNIPRIYEYTEDESKIKMNEKQYDLHKGIVDLNMNVSSDIGKTFASAVYDVGERIYESFGVKHDYLVLRVVWGESLIRINRDKVRI